MKEPDSNMFGKLTEVQRVTARKLMIESILHTDMKLHGDVEKLLRDTVEFAGVPSPVKGDSIQGVFRCLVIHKGRARI